MPPVKLYAIHGSARSNGNSRILLEELLDGARSARPDLRVKTVRAYEARVDPCIACGRCEEDQVGCVREGDTWRVVEDRLRSSDVLVLASPVYFLGLPAPVKAMVDRLQALWWHRERGGTVATNKGHFRRAGLVLTAAGDGESVFTPSRRTARAAFNTLGFQLVGQVLAGGLEDPNAAEGRADLVSSARELGERLVE